MNTNARANTVSVEDISIIRKIKRHLADCDCCRAAIVEGNNEND